MADKNNTDNRIANFQAIPPQQPPAGHLPPQPPFHTPPGNPQQQPYNQPSQQPYQPYFQQSQQPPYQPYAQHPQQPPLQQQPIPPYPPQQKKRVWPWILCVCLVIAALCLGGCVGFIMGAGAASYETNSNSRSSDNGNSSILDSDIEDYLSDQFGLGTETNNAGTTLTLDELKKFAEELPNNSENGSYTSSLFIVGTDIDPGLYYLEGNQTEEANYYLFKTTDSGTTYTLKVPVVYIGNYYVDLVEGDAIVLDAPESAHMYKANNEPKVADAPYQSGCYRVGIDIDAGTYRITAQAGMSSELSQESAAYVMKDLSFNEDSILNEYYVMQGGFHTITLEDGQYLELFAATAAPVQSS